jgi:cyclohexadieny/prephenate dehydrogenase
MLPFSRVAIIGLGLIGSSLARAIKAQMPTVRVTGHDTSADVRATARRLKLCDDVSDTPGVAVIDADLVILCVPVGAMGAAAAEIAADLPADAIVSDVGSCKEGILTALQTALPGRTVIPAHPVAGTENSGPEAGFASLFKGRWCIITPRSNGCPNSGGAWARMSRRWTRSIMTWCWRSPVICRTLSPTPSSARPAIWKM